MTYPNKELVVLDTGDTPSPFFTRICTDPRVRYTHVKLQPTLAGILSELRTFVAAAETPPRPRSQQGGAPEGVEEPDERTIAAWRAAWAESRAALDAAERDREWWELEDEERGSTSYVELVRAVISLGSKRNWLAANARGSLHANFDDDDIYAPTYLHRMASALRTGQADLVKLSSFMHMCLSVSAKQRPLSLFEPSEQPAWRFGVVSLLPSGRVEGRACGDHVRGGVEGVVPTREFHGVLWGYGFSYVNTAALVASSPWPHTNFGEDYALVRDAAARDGRRCLAFASGRNDAVALHMTHGDSSSVVPTAVDQPLFSLPKEPREADGAAFDSFFDSPVFALVQALSADKLVQIVRELEETKARIAERIARQRMAFETGADRAPSDHEDFPYEMHLRQSCLELMGMRDESTVLRAWKRHPSSSTSSHD